MVPNSVKYCCYFVFQRRGVVAGVDYGATGEIKKVDVSRMRKRLDDDCIVILSNLGYSSSGETLNCKYASIVSVSVVIIYFVGNYMLPTPFAYIVPKQIIYAFIYFSTYEVATACALAIEADKLICIIDGPILDESRRLIRFLTLEEADMLIRRRAQQSETAASYVKAVDEENLSGFEYDDHNAAHQNGRAFKQNHTARFHNGVGFENGNGLWTGEQGFAIGGHERLSRLNGYLSELAAAAFVCRVSS